MPPVLPIVIIHGWSDGSGSFKALADALRNQTQRPVATISLADWESMDDIVTYDDVIAQMDKAWTDAGLPRTPRSVDVIVHSTGALVVRDWLVRNFGNAPPITGPGALPVNPSPIYHLIMLAPANFGSPLAHKGTSFIGRVVKGWHAGELFQVGALILKGLELGSAYTWNLAKLDRFGSLNFYDVGGALTTVIVGNTGWSGISAAANEPGSDGTVRVSTANLNSTYVRADFTNVIPGQPPPPASYGTPVDSTGRAAFLVIDGLNHSQVHDPTIPAVISAVVNALLIDDAGFYAYCDALDAQTASVYQTRESQSDNYYWGYQNAAFFVHDQFEEHVQDYFIEFYDDHASNFLEDLFHRKILQDVHAFTDDNAFRAMLLDIKTLRDEFAKQNVGELKISLTAQPDFQNHKAGYCTFNDQDIGAVTLNAADVQRLFVPNQTLLVEIVLKRYQQAGVFRFS